MDTKLECEFTFGHCNGTMCLEVFDGDKLLKKYQNDSLETETLVAEISLPTQLKFVVSGKNYNTDTKVDEQGNITADKCVILKNLKLGNIPIGVGLLYSMLSSKDVYFGRNDTITVDFDEDDFILWHLKNQNKFNIG